MKWIIRIICPLFFFAAIEGYGQCDMPILNILGDTDATICFGTDQTVQVSSCPDAPSLNFDWSTGEMGMGLNQILLSNLEMDSLVSVHITGSGIDTTLSLNVTVLAELSVEIEIPSSVLLCDGQDLTLIANPSIPVGNFEWSNNISPGNMQMESILGISDGDYTFSVEIEDVQGCTASDILMLTVNELPEPVIDGELMLCAGDELNLIGSGASECEWLLPDDSMNNNCNLIVPDVNADDSGTYQLSVLNTTTGCSDSTAVEVMVNTSMVSLDPIGISEPFELCLNADEVDLNPDFGDGEYTLNGTPNMGVINGDDEFNPTDAGIGEFTIIYTTDIGGCIVQDEIEITVLALPQLNWQDIPVLCLNSPSIDFNDFVSPSGGDVFIDNSPTADPIFTPTSIDFTNVEYVYQDPSTMCINSIDTTIQVIAAIALEMDDDLNICNGADPLLGGQASGGGGTYSYSWEPNEFLESNDIADPELLSSLSDTTSFMLTINDQNNCTISGEQTVNWHPQPEVSISTNQLEYCLGNIAILTANIEAAGVGIPTFEWEGDGMASGNQFTTDPLLNPDQDFNVTLSYDDDVQAGCSPDIDVEVIIPIQVNPNISPTSEVLEVCANGQAVLFAENIGDFDALQWNVDPITGVDTTVLEEAFVIQWGNSSAGTYEVILEEIYSSECKGVDTLIINVSAGNSLDPAEILYFDWNDLLVYNDNTADCYQWGYFDTDPSLNEDSYVILDGENFQSLALQGVIDSTLIYWCMAWSGDCNEAPECPTVSIRNDENGSSFQEFQSAFKLFPNPSSGKIQLSMNTLVTDTEHFVRIHNTLGQMVFEKTFTSPSRFLNLDLEISEIKNGFYVLSVYRGDRKITNQNFILAK